MTESEWLANSAMSDEEVSVRLFVIRFSKCGSWLGTAIILLICGWLIAGGILRLITEFNTGGDEPQVSYLPYYPGLDYPGVIAAVVCFLALAVCQVLAVARRVFLCGLIIGLAFFSVGLLGMIVACISVALPQKLDEEFDLVSHVLIPGSVIAFSLIFGLSMVVSAYHPGKRPKA